LPFQTQFFGTGTARVGNDEIAALIVDDRRTENADTVNQNAEVLALGYVTTRADPVLEARLFELDMFTKRVRMIHKHDAFAIVIDAFFLEFRGKRCDSPVKIARRPKDVRRIDDARRKRCVLEHPRLGVAQAGVLCFQVKLDPRITLRTPHRDEYGDDEKSEQN
jgi:hypothetical protein